MLRRGEASGSSVWCAPDSLLEGDGFELPVPGRIYSAAMRSQGDLPVFLAFAGQARRRNEDHALALEAHPAHLIAADPGRIRRRVTSRSPS